MFANVRARSAQLMRGLYLLSKRHPCIADVRGRGLMVGVEFGGGGGGSGGSSSNGGDSSEISRAGPAPKGCALVRREWAGGMGGRGDWEGAGSRIRNPPSQT